MNIASIIKGLKDPSAVIDSFALSWLEQELGTALDLYWKSAEGILAGSGISLREKRADFSSLEKNFFSALFLYSYQRAGISPARRVLYAAINQCLRGMVTGCDNILDDEYKKTLDTDLPESAVRFRSIMDIMVSERVLFELLMRSVERGEMTFSQATRAGSASLRALTLSGAQEASEEAGIKSILRPDEVIESVHHYKTGLLFQAPWAVPDELEDKAGTDTAVIKNSLYRIGIGCQILDDMVDLASDVSKKRHNYVASLIYHLEGEASWSHLQALAQAHGAPSDLILHFNKARKEASKNALHYLEGGLASLFEQKYHMLIVPARVFLAERIGADRFL